MDDQDDQMATTNPRRLPTELCEMILQNLDKASTARTMQASKFFNVLAQPYLYRDVTLTRKNARLFFRGFPEPLVRSGKKRKAGSGLGGKSKAARQELCMTDVAAASAAAEESASNTQTPARIDPIEENIVFRDPPALLLWPDVAVDSDSGDSSDEEHEEGHHGDNDTATLPTWPYATASSVLRKVGHLTHIQTLRIASIPSTSLSRQLVGYTSSWNYHETSSFSFPIHRLILGFGVDRGLANWVDLHHPTGRGPKTEHTHPFVLALSKLFRPTHLCVHYGSDLTTERYIAERMLVGREMLPVGKYEERRRMLSNRWDPFYASSNSRIISILTTHWTALESFTVHGIRTQELPQVQNITARGNCRHRYVYAGRSQAITEVEIKEVCQIARRALSRGRFIPSWEFINIEGSPPALNPRTGGQNQIASVVASNLSLAILNDEEDEAWSVGGELFNDPPDGIRGRTLSEARERCTFKSRKEAAACVCCGLK
jgi:hypothetical protein